MRRILAFVLVASLLVAGFALTACGGSEVPDVTGMKQADAVRALEDAGYKLGDVSFVATTTVPLGSIATQDPAAGERAKEGSAVSLGVVAGNGENVSVPNVSNMPLSEAENIAKTLGLTTVASEQYTTEVTKGNVATQVPEAGSTVRTGSILVLVVSKGPEPAKAKVPDVVGKTQADAEKALKDAGFTTEVFSVYDSKVAKGKVGAQLPKAGDSVLAESKVQIMVSLGPGTGAIKVPTVTGKKEADAVSAIESAGLKVKKLTEYSDKVAKGIVSQQFPAAGATAAAGSEVIMVVSLGVQPAATVAVPNVVGLQTDEATSTLDAAGFAFTTEEVANETAVGAVFYQFPAAAAQATPGSSVLIVVGVTP